MQPSQPPSSDVFKTMAEAIQKIMLEGYTTDVSEWINKENPHLSHDCASPQFEVYSTCHPGSSPAHRYERVHTILYKKDGEVWEVVIAETTCGQYFVWAD